MQKSLFSSVTIWGLLATAAGAFGVPAIEPGADTKSLVLTLLGLVLALIGRWRQGDLTIGPAPKNTAGAILLIATLASVGCASSAQPQELTGKGNEVYMPVAGWKARAKTHTGTLGSDQREGDAAAANRIVRTPMLDADGKPVIGPDGKVLYTEVSGYVGDVYVIAGDLDAHQEIQVPGTSTVSASKSDTSTPSTQTNPSATVTPGGATK